MENRMVNRSYLCGLVTVGGEGFEDSVWEGEYGTNTVYTYTQMKNVRLVETISGMEEEDKGK
jgi:hypothetical protein